MWRIARDSGVLDLNSSYAYLLWCTDFPSTSAVARVDGEPIDSSPDTYALPVH